MCYDYDLFWGPTLRNMLLHICIENINKKLYDVSIDIYYIRHRCYLFIILIINLGLFAYTRKYLSNKIGKC